MRMINQWIGLSVAVVALQAPAADVWQHVTNPPLPNVEIQMLKLGAEKGVVWLGTPAGAAKIEDGTLHRLPQSKGLKVWDVTKLPAGGLWIGHSSGALLVDGERTVTALKGLNVPSIQMVGTQLWAIAKEETKDRNTLMQADGEEWEPVEMFKKRNVLDLVPDVNGTFWLVIDGDGVMEVEANKGLDVVRQHLSRMNVTSVMTDSKGNTWCGLMSGGVMMRQNNVWKRQLERENSAVLSLLEDGTGKIWAATSGNGVWVSDGKDWKNMLPEGGYVALLKMTADKRIWISTQQNGGLQCWNGTEWIKSLACAAPVNSLVELPQGVLLAGSTLDGLYVMGNYSIKGE